MRADRDGTRCPAEMHVLVDGETTCTLYGKGWSLDGHDFAADGPLRVGINEAALVVPGCTFGVTMDPEVLVRWDRAPEPRPALVVAEAMDLTLEPAREALARVRPIPASRVGYCKPGTAAWVIGMLADAGITRIVAVGFDSYWEPDLQRTDPRVAGRMNPYADCVVGAYRYGRPTRTHRYDDINNAIRQAIARHGVEFVDGAKFAGGKQ